MPLFANLRKLLALALLLCSATLHAADHAETEQVKVRLIAERNLALPGSDVLIGLEQRIIPHWHTYWQNPGDSGMPTSIAWTLPAGASAGPIQWPVPTRQKQGALTNFGYAGSALLLTSIHIPANAKAGNEFPVTAKASWLVCEEICIPQQAELTLTLKIVAPGTRLPAANPAISAARTALPKEAPWAASTVRGKDTLQLRIASPELAAQKFEEIWFYPLKWGKLDHGAPQSVSRDGDALLLTLHYGEAPPTADESLEGLLVVSEKSADGVLAHGFNLRAAPASTAPAAATSEGATDGEHLGVLLAMLLAFAGGIILNLMPCVFPVLSIKALSLVRHGTHASREIRMQGLAYTAGVVSSFLLLAAILLLLRAGGAQIGWGFQFQSPGFVLAIAWLMFAIGLSLSGVFTLGNAIAGLGEDLTEKPGYAGSFFTGMLATVVATPCTAPFMGGAIAYALSQSAPQLVAVFVALGLGLALPYLLLSNWPRLQRCLPKPGVWMERLKQLFAFPMYATALWLCWVLVQQTGPDGLLPALGGMFCIALAAWLFDATRLLATPARRLATVLALAFVVLACGAAYSRLPQTQTAVTAAGADFEAYSEARLQALRAEGKPVFLNFTAAWCITCLVNERVALSQASVKTAFKQDGITYLKGDWTNQDAAITAKLAEFGRNGVPLYVFYAAGKDAKPVVLPQILTPESVIEHIRPPH